MKVKYMQLGGNTMRNLEILQNQSGKENGSLLWLLDNTSTSFGRRLLIEWIKHPLLDIK